MTSLQQMAFDRISTLNEECRKMLPSRFGVTQDRVELSVDTIHELMDKLFEQQNFIEALWDEERKDGCEELI